MEGGPWSAPGFFYRRFPHGNTGPWFRAGLNDRIRPGTINRRGPERHAAGLPGDRKFRRRDLPSRKDACRAGHPFEENY